MKKILLGLLGVLAISPEVLAESFSPGPLPQAGLYGAAGQSVGGIVAGANIAVSPASPCVTGSCSISVISATGLSGPISTSDNAPGSLNIGLATSGLSVATISANSAAALPQPIAGSMMQVTAADGIGTSFDLAGFGVNPGALFSMFSAAGTAAAPTASPGAVTAERAQYGGYDSSAWAIGASLNTVFAPSGSTWTPTDHGMRMAFNITPSGATTNETILALDAATNSVAIGGTLGADSLRVASVASAVDQIQVSGGVSASNIATIAAIGSDTSVGINLTPQGSGKVNVTSGGLASTGGISTTTSFTSTVATGTAPLVVTSTTNVPNLNASSLAGATFAAPGGIGGTTPSTIKTTALTLATVAESATAPSIASGFCSSPTVSNNNGTAAFTITVGSSCAASVGVITMPAASHGWACHGNDLTTPASYVIGETATASTSVSVTAYARTTGLASNWTASDVIQFICAGY